MDEEKKTKIVLDSDVIIHFAKGRRLKELPGILPEYQFLLLNVVKLELSEMILSILNNMVKKDKTLKEAVFGESDSEKREYSRLISSKELGFGRGESACMVYCLYHKDVLGSSNIKDIQKYCNEKGITYLTTIDFLYFAIKRGKMTKEEANTFISQVVEAGSRLPSVDFDKYVCDKL